MKPKTKALAIIARQVYKANPFDGTKSRAGLKARSAIIVTLLAEGIPQGEIAKEIGRDTANVRRSKENHVNCELYGLFTEKLKSAEYERLLTINEATEALKNAVMALRKHYEKETVEGIFEIFNNG